MSLFYLKDNNFSFHHSLGELAINLFTNLQLFDCDNKIVYFVATLFVINMSYCTLLRKNDNRYKFIISLIKEMSADQLKIIEKAIIFRQKSFDDFDMYFDNRYEESVDNLKVLISKEIDKRKR